MKSLKIIGVLFLAFSINIVALGSNTESTPAADQKSEQSYAQAQKSAEEKVQLSKEQMVQIREGVQEMKDRQNEIINGNSENLYNKLQNSTSSTDDNKKIYVAIFVVLVAISAVYKFFINSK